MRTSNRYIRARSRRLKLLSLSIGAGNKFIVSPDNCPKQRAIVVECNVKGIIQVNYLSVKLFDNYEPIS